MKKSVRNWIKDNLNNETLGYVVYKHDGINEYWLKIGTTVNKGDAALFRFGFVKDMLKGCESGMYFITLN